MSNKPNGQRAGFKTSVSMSHVVRGFADDCMKLGGFNNNFSAYITHLIRRDKEQQDAADARTASRARKAARSTTKTN